MYHITISAVISGNNGAKNNERRRKKKHDKKLCPGKNFPMDFKI